MAMTTMAMAAVLAGCARSGSEGSTSQLVAKVNKSEITVLELNAALAHVPNLNPQSAKPASKQVLLQLIDEELLVQKAREAKLDRNPGVVQALEAAKRAVLANAWLQQSTADIPKPTEQDIQAYFEQHPEYFTARRLYEYRSVPIRAAPAEVQSIQQQAAASRNLDAVLGPLRGNGTPVAINAATQSSEQLPQPLLARFAEAKDGDILSFPRPDGVELVQLVGSRPEPVDATQARPFIEKFLLEQRRKQRIEKEIQSLRVAANIEYLGEFKPGVEAAAAQAAPAAQAGQPSPGPAKSPPPDPAAGIAAGIR